MSEKLSKRARFTVVFKKKYDRKRKSIADRNNLKKCKEIQRLESRINSTVPEEIQRAPSDCCVQSQLESETQLPVDNFKQLRKSLRENEENSSEKSSFNKVYLKDDDIGMPSKTLTDDTQMAPKRSSRMSTTYRTEQVSESSFPSVVGIQKDKRGHPKILPKPSDCDHNIAFWGEQHNQFMKEVQNMESKYRDESKRYEVLEDSVQAVKNENTELKDKKFLMKQPLATFEEEKCEMNTVINELERSNDPTELKKLKERIKDLEYKKNILYEESEAMKKKMEDFVINNRRLSNYTWDVEKYLDKISDELEDVEEKNIILRKEKRELRMQNEHLSKEITDLKNIGDYFENTLKSVQTKNKEMTEKITELEEINKSQMKKIKEQETKIEIFIKSILDIVKNLNILPRSKNQEFLIETNEVVEETIANLKKRVEDVVNNDT